MSSRLSHRWYMKDVTAMQRNACVLMNIFKHISTSYICDEVENVPLNVYKPKVKIPTNPSKICFNISMMMVHDL